jgi:hypothetical protein
MQSAFRLLIWVIPLLAACVDLPDESTTQEMVTSGNQASPNRVTANRVTANRVTANRVTANRVAANRVTANRIAANRLMVNSAASELLATSEGRELFSVLVSCALPSDITLVARINGDDLEFPGALGFAPQWIEDPLDREGQGWVSACVFARINAREVSVDISVRGANPALHPLGRDERETWSLQEGAFYGNMFVPLDQPILWVACRGRDQAAGETGDLVDRDCTEPDPAHPGLTQCGFTYAGDCGNFTGEAACEQSSGPTGFYQRCHAEPIDNEDHHGHHHHHHGAPCDDDDDHIFRQVITTYVTP